MSEFIESTLSVNSSHGFNIGDDIQIGDDYQRLVIGDIPNNREMTVMRKLDYIVKCGLEAMDKAVEDSFHEWVFNKPGAEIILHKNPGILDNVV